MNAVDPVDPIPAYFSLQYMVRYALWAVWSNGLSILSAIQMFVAQATMPDPTNPITARPWIHWVWTGVSALGFVIAIIKRNTAPPPPPVKQSGG